MRAENDIGVTGWTPVASRCRGVRGKRCRV